MTTNSEMNEFQWIANSISAPIPDTPLVSWLWWITAAIPKAVSSFEHMLSCNVWSYILYIIQCIVMLYNLLESFVIYHYMHVYTHIHHHTVCIYIYTCAQIHISKYANATPNISKFHDTQCVNERWFLGNFSGPCQSRLALDQSNTWPSGTFISKTFKKPVELFFPIQKGVFYIFFSEEVADQCNIIPLLLCREKVCTKKIPMVYAFLFSSRHHSCTSVAVQALPKCNLSVHSYLGKPPTKPHANKKTAQWLQDVS